MIQLRAIENHEGRDRVQQQRRHILFQPGRIYRNLEEFKFVASLVGQHKGSAQRQRVKQQQKDIQQQANTTGANAPRWCIQAIGCRISVSIARPPFSNRPVMTRLCSHSGVDLR